MQTADPRWSNLMDGSVDRMVADLLRDLNARKLNYEEARARYRDLGDLLDQEYPPDRTPRAIYNAVHGRYRQLGDAIQNRYQMSYTAVSVDVVGSRDMKSSGSALDAQLTFDAYHLWVDEKLASHGCPSHHFAWAGDGLIAIFEVPETAVTFARALLAGVPVFNTCMNRLKRPLEIRIGVHTGPVLPGEEKGLGRLASATLDLAGHHQKAAWPNEMALSPATYGLLPESLGYFARVRRPIPGAEVCYVYPAPVDDSEATLEMTQALHQASLPMPNGRSAGLGLVFGTLLGAAIVGAGGLWWWTHQPRSGASTASRTVRVEVPRAPSVNVAPTQKPQPVAGPETISDPKVPIVSQPAPAPAPSQQAPSWSPDRRLWRSPDADSGVPVQILSSPAERTWILTIGAGRQQDSSLQAPGAGSDAVFVSQMLQRTTSAPGANVRVLTDEQATLENIKRGFQWLQQSATSGKDTLLVYFAGPARLVPDRPDMRHAGGTSFALAPHDASMADPANTMVYGADIAAWLGAVRAQAVLLLVDTPFAGSLQADLPGTPDPGRQFGLLAATSAHGASNGRGRQASAFAETLTQGLSGAADRNGDRQVSARELHEYLATTLPRNSGGQIPSAAAGFGGYMPDVFFRPR